MLDIIIPGYNHLQLQHLVLDYNGTLACDGQLLTGVKSRLERLAKHLQVHVVTADTFGSVKTALADVSCQLYILPSANQDTGKRDYVEQLGISQAVCIGNGRNDSLMLAVAALGIVVLQEEGAAVKSLLAADVAAPDILAALDLLLQPKRLVATLRC